MSYKEFSDWIEKNSVNQTREYCNGIDYIFVTRNDGWIAIFEIDCGNYNPVIEATDYQHARSYIAFREKINFPITALC